MLKKVTLGWQRFRKFYLSPPFPHLFFNLSAMKVYYCFVKVHFFKNLKKNSLLAKSNSYTLVPISQNPSAAQHNVLPQLITLSAS